MTGCGVQAEEDDPFIVLDRLLGGGQHAGLRAFDQLEAFELVRRIGDHFADDAVAVIAGFDAIDLGAELVLVGADVGEALDARVGHILRNDEAIARALEIGADVFDRLLVEIGLHVRRHRRHPVAEEDVDVLVLHRGIGDRHRERARFRAHSRALRGRPRWRPSSPECRSSRRSRQCEPSCSSQVRRRRRTMRRRQSAPERPRTSLSLNSRVFSLFCRKYRWSCPPAMPKISAHPTHFASFCWTFVQ